MVKDRIFIFVIGLLVAVVSKAGDYSASIDTLKAVHKIPAQDLEKLRAKITSMVPNDADPLSPEMKNLAKTAFEELFKLLVRNHSENSKKELTNIISNISVSETSAYFSPREKRIYMVNLGKYQGSLAYFTTITHEATHSGQDFLGLKLTNGIDTGYFSDESQVRLEIEIEVSAMSWEWAYLNLFPDHLRLRLAEKLKSDTDTSFDPYLKELYVRIITNGGLSRMNFLRKEWVENRYSPKFYAHLYRRSKNPLFARKPPIAANAAPCDLFAFENSMSKVLSSLF